MISKTTLSASVGLHPSALLQPFFKIGFIHFLANTLLIDIYFFPISVPCEQWPRWLVGWCLCAAFWTHA